MKTEPPFAKFLPGKNVNCFMTCILQYLYVDFFFFFPQGFRIFMEWTLHKESGKRCPYVTWLKSQISSTDFMTFSFLFLLFKIMKYLGDKLQQLFTLSKTLVQHFCCIPARAKTLILQTSLKETFQASCKPWV